MASLAHCWLDQQFWTLADHLQARPLALLSSAVEFDKEQLGMLFLLFDLKNSDWSLISSSASPFSVG